MAGSYGLAALCEPLIRFHCSSASIRLLKDCNRSEALNQNFNAKKVLKCRQRPLGHFTLPALNEGLCRAACQDRIIMAGGILPDPATTERMLQV